MTKIKDDLIELDTSGLDVNKLLEAQKEDFKEMLVIEDLEVVDFETQADKKLDDIKASLSQFSMDIVGIVLTSKNEKERDDKIHKHILVYGDEIFNGGNWNG